MTEDFQTVGPIGPYPQKLESEKDIITVLVALVDAGTKHTKFMLDAVKSFNNISEDIQKIIDRIEAIEKSIAKK